MNTCMQLESEQDSLIFHTMSKYVVLSDLNAKFKAEEYFKEVSGEDSLHEATNANELRLKTCNC